MRSIVAAVLASALLQAHAGPALAASGPLVTRMQDISRKACTIKPRTSAPQEHETEDFACKPFAGWRVRYAYHGAFVQVTFDPPGGRAQVHTLGAGSDLGERIEWYGSDGQGGFAPQAAVVRLRWREDGVKSRSVLALVRIESKMACAAAFIDATANANANETIRAAVPGAAGFRCGVDQPAILGKTSEWAEEAAARVR